MDLDTARILCDLIELQNFSRVAEKHGISQSAVSQQIAQIELVHKCQLINRKRRPLKPTEAGELFYQACKEMLERYDRLKSDLNALADSPSRINLAAIFSIGMHSLQPYVKKFMLRYPDVKLNIEYGSTSQIYSRILDGRSDLGAVAVPRSHRNIDIYPLENEPLVFVCNPEHPLANELTMDVHKLQGQDFIAFEKNVPTRILIDNILTQYDVIVRTVMEFDNTETIKRAVEINSGVSILPKTTLNTEVSNGTLRAIYFSNENFYRPTGIIVRKDKLLSLAGRYLIELLRKRLDENP